MTCWDYLSALTHHCHTELIMLTSSQWKQTKSIDSVGDDAPFPFHWMYCTPFRCGQSQQQQQQHGWNNLTSYYQFNIKTITVHYFYSHMHLMLWEIFYGLVFWCLLGFLLQTLSQKTFCLRIFKLQLLKFQTLKGCSKNSLHTHIHRYAVFRWDPGAVWWSV